MAHPGTILSPHSSSTQKIITGRNLTLEQSPHCGGHGCKQTLTTSISQDTKEASDKYLTEANASIRSFSSRCQVLGLEMLPLVRQVDGFRSLRAGLPRLRNPRPPAHSNTIDLERGVDKDECMLKKR